MSDKNPMLIIPVPKQAQLDRFRPIPDVAQPVLRSDIQALMEAAFSTLGQHPHLLNQQYYLKFSPEVMIKLRNGTYHIMPSAEGGIRAIATHNSRIVAQGSLVASSARVAVAAMQIAAVITAQSYLGEISARLDAITQSIATLQHDLEDLHRKQLLADIEYLQGSMEIAPHEWKALSPEGRVAKVNEIERILRETPILIAHYRDKLNDLAGHIHAVDPSTWFKGDARATELIKLRGRAEQFGQIIFLALSVQICAIEGMKLRDAIADSEVKRKAQWLDTQLAQTSTSIEAVMAALHTKAAEFPTSYSDIAANAGKKIEQTTQPARNLLQGIAKKLPSVQIPPLPTVSLPEPMTTPLNQLFEPVRKRIDHVGNFVGEKTQINSDIPTHIRDDATRWYVETAKHRQTIAKRLVSLIQEAPQPAINLLVVYDDTGHIAELYEYKGATVPVEQ